MSTLALVLTAWIVAVPVIAVSGLYAASHILGARARRRGFPDVGSFAFELARLERSDDHRLTPSPATVALGHEAPAPAGADY